MDFVEKEPYCVVKPSSWNQAKEIGKSLGQFIFRGQNNPSWPLETTLKRASNRRFMKSRWVLSLRETEIIQNFKSRAHNYLQSLPQDEDNIEWLSIIQEFGGPTRLLDFTESFYIAAFFALEDADGDSAVWCIHNNKIIENIINEGNEKINTLADINHYARTCIGRPKNNNLVIRLNPLHQNQRQIVQKGTFLFPCNIENSFEENLCKSFHLSTNSLEDNPSNRILLSSKKRFHFAGSVLKIIFDKAWSDEAFDDLYYMNIDAASLFPDLSGFARSLKYHVRDTNPGDRLNT